jgi:hypothetical protein
MARVYDAPAAERATRELTRDPDAADALLAGRAGCSPSTVSRVRADLTASGLIRLHHPARFSPNPGAYDRASAALADNPYRSNKLLAQLCGCTVRTIGRARYDLERLGLIRYVPAADRLAPLPAAAPRPQLTAAARVLIDDPARSDAVIAAEAGCSAPTVYRARALCESMGLIGYVPPAQRADRRGDRLRPVADAAAAADVLVVRRTARRPVQPPKILGLPPPPDWSEGLCTRAAPEHRGWWTSTDAAEREAALRCCAACPCGSRARTGRWPCPRRTPPFTAG